MTRFICHMVSRVDFEVDYPDGRTYTHESLVEAVKDQYGDRLGDLLAESAYMGKYDKVRE